MNFFLKGIAKLIVFSLLHYDFFSFRFPLKVFFNYIQHIFFLSILSPFRRTRSSWELSLSFSK